MEENNEEQLSQEELENLQHLIGTAPIPEEKHNVHLFLTKVAEADDTRKVANIDEEELGKPKLPVRTNLELALFCKDIADMEDFGNYFEKEAEIILATSLSKEGFLDKLAITTSRNIADVTNIGAPKKKNSGWFKKKNG